VETKRKITISERKRPSTSNNASISQPIKPPHINNPLPVKVMPCHGISVNTHGPHVSIYLSRTYVEGAGSISLQNAAKIIYGSDAKYSELTHDQKRIVTVAQIHLREWSINRELQVVFSTKCEKFIEQDQKPPICTSC
jgi:hypothetical protein